MRTPGAWIKHRVKEDRLEMYDKGGLVFRVETVIDKPRGIPSVPSSPPPFRSAKLNFPRILAPKQARRSRGIAVG